MSNMFYLPMLSVKTLDFMVDGIPVWVAPFIVLFFVAFIGIYYQWAMKRAETYAEIQKPAFMIFLVIRWITKTTSDIMGKSYKFAVPFFIYIIFYFWLGSAISIFGIPAVGSSFVIPATVSIFVLLGTILSGICHRRWYYFSDFCVWVKIKNIKIFPIPDPLKFIGELSKIISLSCRLWGNCLAGSVILFVCYFSLGQAFESLSMSWAGVLTIPAVIFPLHIYFDIIDGGLQAMIFMFLTMSYWAMASQSEPTTNNN